MGEIALRWHQAVGSPERIKMGGPFSTISSQV